MVKVRIQGIPVEVDYGIDPADPSVGIMYASLEDITFYNVKNGSRMDWLNDKLDRLGDKAWDEAHEIIWAAIEKQRNDY